jgi:hypothetical protein
MIELIFICLLSSLTLLFLSLYVIQKKANKVIIAKTLEALLLQQLTRAPSKTEQDQSDEAFLKFVSDSRDWAYQYIEEVQAGLKLFIDEVAPQIDYYNKYGSAVDGMIAPHDFALKKISSEFEKLKALLPEDYDRIV